MNNREKKNLIMVLTGILAVSVLIFTAVFWIFLKNVIFKGNADENRAEESTEAVIADSSAAEDSSEAEASDGEITAAEAETMGDEASAETEDAGTEEAPSDEAALSESPTDIINGPVYKAEFLNRAQAFKDECAQRFPEAEDDLARFCLYDINKDGVPELVMHDVTGEHASYCTYINGAVTPAVSIYDNREKESEIQNYGAFGTLYSDVGVFIKYEFSNDYAESGFGGIKQVLMPDHAYNQVIISSFYYINQDDGMPAMLSQVSVVRSISGEDCSYTLRDAAGNGISEEDYKNVFKSLLGEDNFRKFFSDEMMIADGDYDFRSELLWNSTKNALHMTFDEFSAFLSSFGVENE